MLAPSDITEPYVDLLGEDEDPTGRLPGQRLMASRVLPLVYERLWRPVGGRILMRGIDMAAEHRLALEMMGFPCQASELLRRRSPRSRTASSTSACA